MSLHDVISLWWPLAVFMLLYLQYKHKKERDAKVALARRLDSLQREHAMVTASNAARGTELEETRRQRDAVDEALGRARAERDAFEADARELGAAAALAGGLRRRLAAQRPERRVPAELRDAGGRGPARGFGFAQGADGHYRVVAAAAAAGVASGFYATATRRLEAARAAAPPPRRFASRTSSSAGPKDGTCRPRWEPFEPAAAQRVYAWLAHCQGAARVRGGAASGYERSVSFMTAAGRAYEPPVLCCGGLECRRGDGTRDVDRER
ncbi:hypothetical protein JL720_547 [Aureococcus anophagefferens]|nr:hypothetical protein JL720_547 [Aureococcus anophagefferens]